MREPVGLILAGGRSSRMGGGTKAELELGGRRLVDLSLDRLEPQVSAVAINANDPLDATHPVIADTMKGHLGPLAGIQAGLDWAITQNATHMVSVAVDTPFFPCDLVPRLLMAGAEAASGLAVAATADGDHGTFAIWPVSVRDELAAYLANGGRKVRDFTDAHSAGKAMFADTTPPAFFNINTPDDAQMAAQWL